MTTPTAPEAHWHLANDIDTFWNHPLLQPPADIQMAPPRTLTLPRMTGLPNMQEAARRPHQLTVARIRVEAESPTAARTLHFEEAPATGTARLAGSLAIRISMGGYRDERTAPAMAGPWAGISLVSAHSPEGPIIEGGTRRHSLPSLFYRSHPEVDDSAPRDFETYGPIFAYLTHNMRHLINALPATH